MSSCCTDCREEFRLRRFGWSCSRSTENITTYQCSSYSRRYVSYRFVLAAYTLITLIYTSLKFVNKNNPWSVYFTHWTYTLICVYFLVQFVIGCYKYYQGNAPTEGRPTIADGVCRKLLQHVLPGILLDVISSSSLMISIVYWSLIFPHENGVNLFNAASVHIMNSVLVVLEQCVIGVPVRLLHVIYPIIYLLIYCLFSLIYWTGDNTRVIYSILNWNHPGITVGLAVLAELIVLPLLHLLVYAIYRVRLCLCNRQWSHYDGYDTDVSNTANSELL